MMVQRRAQEYAMRLRVVRAIPCAPVLEHRALHDHRDRLRREDRADEQQQKLRFQQDRHRTQGSAQCERAGVAHEHFSRVRVVPQKTDQGAEQGHAEYRELSGPAQIIDL
jgi:hypothetical protein